MARERGPAYSLPVLIIILLLSAGTVWQIAELKDDYKRADQRATTFENRLDKTEQEKQESDLAAAQLAEQVKDLGKKPVVEPGEPVTGPQGEQGRPPTPAEISLAVQSYCSGGRCDGKNPTAGQVARAVSVYCNDRDNCRGPEGTQGEPGSEGPQGPGPTNAQVAQAVADYCADGRCKGAQGDPGPTGQTGVVDVKVEGCQELTGKISLDATYDADTRTITITCT